MLLDLDTGRGLILGLLPELILIVWALLLTLHVAWRHQEPGVQRQVGWLTLVGVLAALAATIWLWTSGARLEGIATSVAVDSFRWAATCIILIGVALSTVLSIGYLDREGIAVPEYHVLVLFAAIGMLFMVSGADLLVIFLGLETMSVSIYVLTGINRRSAVSAEAALKYFLLGAFASAFLLYGIALLYGSAGTTRLDLMAYQSAHAGRTMRLMYTAGTAMLIVGFAFKVAAVPFHMWVPDVYDGAPTPVTVLMSATVKAAAFGAFVRILLQGLAGGQTESSVVLLWLAVATMVVGNLLALAQRSLKRMLAYSSIAHAGYLLVALVPGSVAGAGAYLYYLMFYTLATLGAFTVLIAKGRQGERDVTTDDLAGLSESHPVLALVMAVSMLSLLGFPGTAGFIGKWFVVATATGGGHAALAAVLVLTSVISAGYYLPVIMAMYMKPRLHDRAHNDVLLPGVMRGLLVAVMLAMVVFGVWPGKALTTARLGGSAFLSQRITAMAAPRPMPMPRPLPPNHSTPR
jgi:NADH-quinone oxidoreductase subunit N